MNRNPSVTETTQATIPLVEEQLRVDKQRVETGRVRVRTVVNEQLARVSEELEHDEVSVERVAINREVDRAPDIREEGGVLIIPVLEEVLFVEKRLVLKEELHVRKNLRRERYDEAVQVRRMHAEIERVPPIAEGPAGGVAGEAAAPAPAAPDSPVAANRIRRKAPVRR